MILYSLFFRLRNIFKKISVQTDSLYKKASSLAFEKKAGKQIFDYLQKNESRKLHIGCGSNIMPGWLNVDILMGKNTTYLDVTKKSPISADSFDFIFSEHMIEHITLKQAQIMLSECFRVLKPKGIIRLTTPDMAKILELYAKDLSTEKIEYLQWVQKTYLEKPLLEIHNQFINNYFHNWGHQFIYDYATLKQLLIQTGFSNISQVPIYISEHSELNNLEMHHQTIPIEYNLLESFAVEASK